MITMGSQGNEEKGGKKKYTLIVRSGGADEQLVKEKHNVASRLKPTQFIKKKKKKKRKNKNKKRK